MFEVGLSAKQSGDYEQSTGDCPRTKLSEISDVFTIPTQDEIDRYLVEGLGFEKESRYFYGNDLIAITDVFADGDNVLDDGESLYFIDPIIKFKKPAPEVLEHYYKLLK